MGDVAALEAAGGGFCGFLSKPPAVAARSLERCWIGALAWCGEIWLDRSVASNSGFVFPRTERTER